MVWKDDIKSNSYLKECQIRNKICGGYYVDKSRKL